MIFKNSKLKTNNIQPYFPSSEWNQSDAISSNDTLEIINLFVTHSLKYRQGHISLSFANKTTVIMLNMLVITSRIIIQWVRQSMNDISNCAMFDITWTIHPRIETINVTYKKRQGQHKVVTVTCYVNKGYWKHFTEWRRARVYSLCLKLKNMWLFGIMYHDLQVCNSN